MTIAKGELGNAIKEARIKNALSQEAFSEVIGITPTHLKHIESEHRRPSIEVLFKIATTLNMSLDNIIFPQDDKKKKQLQELNNLLSSCTLNELQIVLDLVYSIKRNSL